MKKLSALIIDDEQPAIDGLSELLKLYSPEVEVVGAAGSVQDGIAGIISLKPDLVFLDIELPEGNGFDLADVAAESGCSFVFVTGHSSYAPRAFAVDAVHYLLKPVAYKELRTAVLRVVQRREQKSGVTAEASHRIAISAVSGTQFVDVLDVVGIQADGRYSTVHTRDRQKIVVTRNIGEFEEELVQHHFFRVHKSWLVNCRHVKRVLNADGGTIELTTGQRILISRRRKSEFLVMMKEHS